MGVGSLKHTLIDKDWVRVSSSGSGVWGNSSVSWGGVRGVGGGECYGGLAICLDV